MCPPPKGWWRAYHRGRPSSFSRRGRRRPRARLAEALDGGAAVQDLALPLHDQGVALARGGIEVGGGRLLEIEVVVGVHPAHERRAVPHLRELADVGGDVADRVADAAIGRAV